MNCPKCKQPLIDSTLSTALAVKHCTNCQGSWIPAVEYQAWVSQEPQKSLSPELFSELLNNIDVVPSPFDSKAALCPECHHYLARAKVSMKNPFYVERCPSCTGVWCDEGEWNMLEKLGLSTTIEQLFSSGWQARMREQLHAYQERQAVVDKVGPELAAQLFQLASVLEKHPNGDFAAAYLMRRFDRTYV